MSKVVTGRKTRWSYVTVNQPRAINGSEPKYSVSLIVPKSDTKTVNDIKAAIKATYEDGIGKLKGNGKTAPALDLIHTPLRDGDAERPDDPVYSGCYFMNASSKTKPVVVDADRQPIIDPTEIYSGCYGRASINFFVYNVNGNRGIAAGLNGLQKISDGDHLGGACDVVADFKVCDDDSEEDDLLG